jgi:hypothetical protein
MVYAKPYIRISRQMKDQLHVLHTRSQRPRIEDVPVLELKPRVCERPLEKMPVAGGEIVEA